MPLNRWILATLVAFPGAAMSATPVWEQFVEARKTGAEPVLPDYSWAGYMDSEVPIPDVAGPIFDVTKYGAVGDDNVSDQKAIRDAIAAAQEAGGGVVFFPPGKFLMNTFDDDGKPTFITTGNIVLRGSGMAEGGTIVQMVNCFPPDDPDKMYSTPFLITFLPKFENPEQGTFAKVTDDARRETFSVTVDSTARLRVGQRVTLAMQSTDAIPEFLAPHSPDATMTRLVKGGIQVTERHRIAAIEGNTVTFREPLHTNVTSSYGWTLEPYNVAENVGVEDICFMGNWRQRFVHHRTALDDGGWSILELDSLANSWVRRCSFINTNHAINVRSCSQTSILQVIFAGSPGHFAIHARAGYGFLGGLLEDRALMWHGPSMGYQGVGTIYWRCEMGPEQRMDSHSGQPYVTLYDAINGGILKGMGGPLAGMPHHLRYFTFWNFNHRSKVEKAYQFWNPGKKERFVMPIFVGLHGTPVELDAENLQLLESQGRPVEPESLFEAQLALRLGGLPEWVDKERNRWDEIRAMKLPSHPRYP